MFLENQFSVFQFKIIQTMLWVVATCLIFLLPTKLTASIVPITAMPNWVKDIPVNLNSVNLADAEGGVLYLLVAKQVKLEPHRLFFNVTITKKIINRIGLEQKANIAISYDDSLEKLALHKLILIRNGKAMNILNSSHMEVTRPASQSDNNRYDSTKTLHILLNDVQVGDMIEYSYTFSSRNLVLLNPFADEHISNAKIPIERLYFRYLLQSSKTIGILINKESLKPNITLHNHGIREYEWNLEHVLSQKNEASENHFLIYEKSSWSEIKNLYLPYFQVPRHLSNGLTNEIHRLDQETAKEKLLAMFEPSSLAKHQIEKVLAFVQNNIRYTGTEMGKGNYQPADPSEVYARRYGDCKDKALLMVTMLNQLGIDSHVALVSTELKNSLIDKPPLLLFDHAVVVVSVNDQYYWLDPTRYDQSSDLDHVYIPDYGYALVLDKKSSQLTKIVPSNSQKSEIKIKEVYDLSQDVKKPPSYMIISHYSGQEADRFRTLIAGTNTSEIQNGLEKSNVRYYPFLHSVKPIEIQDDVAKNILTTKEYYEINQLWTYNKNKDETEADILAFIINDYLKKIDDQEGSRRVEVAYPLNIEERITLKMPYSWPIKPTKLNIENDHFIFNQEIYLHDHFIYWINHYSSKKNTVLPQDFAKYNRDIDQIRDNLVQTVFIKGHLKN